MAQAGPALLGEAPELRGEVAGKGVKIRDAGADEGTMSGIPRTPSRWLALAGMVVVLPLAGALFTLSGLTVDGVVDDAQPDDMALAVHWQLVAVVATTAAIVALVGLAAGMRALALLGSVVVTGAAFVVFLDAPGEGHGFEIPVLMVLAIGLTGCRAATVPTPE